MKNRYNLRLVEEKIAFELADFSDSLFDGFESTFLGLNREVGSAVLVVEAVVTHGLDVDALIANGCGDDAGGARQIVGLEGNQIRERELLAVAECVFRLLVVCRNFAVASNEYNIGNNRHCGLCAARALADEEVRLGILAVQTYSVYSVIDVGKGVVVLHSHRTNHCIYLVVNEFGKANQLDGSVDFLGKVHIVFGDELYARPRKFVHRHGESEGEF